MRLSRPFEVDPLFVNTNSNINDHPSDCRRRAFTWLSPKNHSTMRYSGNIFAFYAVIDDVGYQAKAFHSKVKNRLLAR